MKTHTNNPLVLELIQDALAPETFDEALFKKMYVGEDGDLYLVDFDGNTYAVQVWEVS